METQSDAKTATSTGGCQALSREKYWDELNDAEKIERLRIVVKELRQQLEMATNRADRALEIAQDHQHNSWGAVMVSAKPGLNEPSCCGPRRRDEKWI